MKFKYNSIIKNILLIFIFLLSIFLPFLNFNFTIKIVQAENEISYPPTYLLSTNIKNLQSNVYTLEEEDIFGVWDFVNNENKYVTATCKAINRESYIFVDNAIIVGANLTEIGRIIDDIMIPIMDSNFAPPTDRDNNGKIVILLTRISGGVGGYFSSSDYWNYGEIVFIDAELGISDDTLIHEIQHLVHYGLDSNEMRWFDEGCSRFSEILLSLAYGYNHSFSLYYPRGTSLLYWDYDIPGNNYQASQTFIAYLYDQYGSANLSAIYRASSGGVNLHSSAAIMAVVNQYSPSLTFEQLYTNWIIASSIDSRYSGDIREYSYNSFKCMPDYYSFPETGGFAKKYPYEEVNQIDPWATKIYNFRDFPDPNQINISFNVPSGSHDHPFGVNIIKETIFNFTYSEFDLESYYFNPTNISEGFFITLNQTEEGFSRILLTVSHLDGGLGDFASNIPVLEKNVEYELHVISQAEINDSSDTKTLTTPSKISLTISLFTYLIIGIGMTIWRKKR
ncbi:hypothetical protein [Candidatus Hodarchaeum mangrovi]